MRNFYNFFNQKISNFPISLFLAGSLALLAGCGSGVPPGTVVPTTPADPTIALQLYDAAGAVVTSVSPGAPATVKATLKDSTGAAIPSTVVTFSVTDTTLATINQSTALTDSSGVATIVLSSTGAASGATSITATAPVGTATATGTTSFAVISTSVTTAPALTVEITNSSGTAITAISPSIPGTAKATLKDSTGAAIPNTVVAFSVTDTTKATVTPLTALTNASGIATATLTAKGFGATTLSASAQVGGTQVNASTSFSSTINTPSLSLSVSPSTISTGVNSAVTATLLDGTGAVAPNVVVTFAVADGALATLGSTTATTNAFGVATTTLSAAGTATGSSTISATAQVNGVTANSGSASFSVVSTAAVATSLSLSASPTTVKSDNSTSTTVTVAALSATNAVLPNVTVNLSANTGILGSQTVTTDATGRATFTFSSGTASKSNRTATITASSGGVSAQLPVDIVGSTLTVNATGTTVPVCTPPSACASVTMTFTAKDAGGNPISGAAVTLTKPTGVTLTPAAGTTNASGQLVITVTGTSVISGDVTATAVGATTSAPITVTSTAATFGISLSKLNGDASIANPTAVTMPLQVIANNASIAGDGVTVTVASTAGLAGGISVSGGGFPAGTTVSSVTNATTFVASASSTLTLPVSGQTLRFNVGSRLVVLVKAPLPTSTVVFATTMGSWWNGLGTNVSVPVAAGTVCGFAGYTITTLADEACATLTTSAAGLADIQVQDAAVPGTNDTLTVSMTATTPYKVTLQASPSLVSKSVGSTTGISELIATVKDIDDQPVGGVPVSFSILNPTGGSEHVSPVIVYTAATATASLSLGEARTTFTSGSQSSSANGVQVRATVLGAGGACPGATCVATEANIPAVLNVSASGNDAAIVIGGTVGSIAFGQATVLGETANATNYTLAMSALVTDLNGNPVPGTVVNLSAWPIAWSTGNNCSVGFAASNYTGAGDVAAGTSVANVTPAFNLAQQTALVGQFVQGGGFPLGTVVVSIASGGASFVASKASTATGLGMPISIGQLATYYNEDVNENGFLDNGEDGTRDYYYGGGSATGGWSDGLITPVNSASGTVPGTVITDATGLATFTLTYPKTSAIWTVVRIRAKTVVQGSETRSETQFPLAPLKKDVDPDCLLGSSPYVF